MSLPFENYNPYSVNDPSSKTSLKVKPLLRGNKFHILFEVIHLKEDNMTQKYAVEYFMDIEDFDYIQELYKQKLIGSEKGIAKQKGYKGAVRAIRFISRYEKKEAGHLTISIVNGTGTPHGNGFTPKLEQIKNKRMINMTFEQAIKMFKYIDRTILAYTISRII